MSATNENTSIPKTSSPTQKWEELDDDDFCDDKDLEIFIASMERIDKKGKSPVQENDDEIVEINEETLNINPDDIIDPNDVAEEISDELYAAYVNRCKNSIRNNAPKTPLSCKTMEGTLKKATLTQEEITDLRSNGYTPVIAIAKKKKLPAFLYNGNMLSIEKDNNFVPSYAQYSFICDFLEYMGEPCASTGLGAL